MGQDTVSSYTGFRTVTSEEVNGVQRILLVSLDTVSLSMSKGSGNLTEWSLAEQVVAHRCSCLERCVETSLKERERESSLHILTFQ
jgi:hypothetical protein